MAAAVRLVAIGSEALRAYPLAKSKITVGTAADNDLVIEHSSVSRRHAEIFRRLGSFRVRDLGSTNGTRINGRRTTRSHRLVPGDELEFGAVRFAVMNSPRVRRALGMRSVLAIAAGLSILGFGLAQYLRLYGLTFRTVSPPAVSRPSHAAGTPQTSPRGATAPVSEAEGTAEPVPEAAASPKPAAPMAEPTDEEGWLKVLNGYRAMAGLEAVREDSLLSAGGFKHARYLVKNNAELIKGGELGAEMHTEGRGRPWFSPEGLRAARSGDVEQWWGPHPTSRPAPGWAIDDWIASTWHRMWILNPRLREVGYGEYCENGACVAVLDLLSRLGASGFAPAAVPAPIAFPPDAATVRIAALGDEWPDPLSSCRGFSTPAGLPITIQLGAFVPARLSAFSLRRGDDSQTLEACGFDASSYVNPNSAEQDRAGEIMRELGAVVVIPRERLAPGDYKVEMTVNGHSYRWRFTIEGNAG
jgi:uncharacterized protein YkwD